MHMLPQDPFILLSYINTRLRDSGLGLDELCGELSIDRNEITARLAGIGYAYDEKKNSFK